MRQSDLESFLAVVRHGSFRAAARERGLTGSALSQTIRALEEDLQVRLFNRTTRSVVPTEAGDLLARRLTPALADIRASLDEVRSIGGRPSGRVRMNAPAPALDWLIVPHLPEFLRSHPDIAVEIIEDASNVDIVAEGYDVGIRLGLEMAQDMIALPLGPEQDYAVVGSPEYLEREGWPETPQDLTLLDCIRHRFPSGTIFPWRFRIGEEDIAIVPQGRLTVSNARHAVEAATAGIGLARVALPYAQGDLRQGRLVRILDRFSPQLPAWHLYYPSRRHMPPALRAFIDFFMKAAR
ncbi:LysR family transcriptional regulator [Nitratireductor sp. ZSWI3]|uniref:LysR family transcriptional regulator n=1 Tax=Nitratireductor sp. ZSWI3 TaxID=2966359 RepID=UPI0021500AA1|nr:LysR family transcriptional regulator [Nitratireductor sp. ZSWI3]MCR4265070.1 LysR family transcriptional regulator [Nitratireductor sp. ZSWI3]